MHRDLGKQDMPHALLIDDDQDDTLKVSEIFRRQGFSVNVADSQKSARDNLLRQLPEVMLINAELGGKRNSGLEVIEGLDLSRVTEIYLVSDKPSLETARLGMQLGASDYFARPVDANLLRERLESFQDAMKVSQEEDIVHASGRGLLVGESPPMQRLYKLLRKVAPTEAAVMLVGETGTGKELCAKTIHELSQRADGPLVAVNCGAISPELMESELFGHIKGAFTGANRNHRGFFERAKGGTLFLDEVTEMPAELQVKLLRVLETQSVVRVGDEREIKVNCRIISSTNRVPDEAVSEDILREDLYYRLAQFPVRVPPLRERGSDIGLLADYFLGLRNQEFGSSKNFSERVRESMRLHAWPGNVRELRNVVQRAYILAGTEIDLEDLPGNIPGSIEAAEEYVRIHIGCDLAEAERRIIYATLESHDGDKKKTAETLGISVKTLYNRLKAYDFKT